MKIVKLEELCDDIIDCPHTTPKWQNKGIPVLRNYNFKNGNIDKGNLSYVDENTYIERTKRANPEMDDIVISREAPIGAVCIIPKNFKCCLGQRLVLLKVNKAKCNAKYLLYMLMSDFVKKQTERYEHRGSIVSNLNISYLKEIKIPFADDKDMQNKIVEVLSNVDNQILRNNDMVQKLPSFNTTLSCFFKKGEMRYVA